MPYTGVGIDGTWVCDECGCLIADGWQIEHNRQHPHPYDHDPYHDWATEPARHDCVMCRLPESAAVHQTAPPPSTPAHAHAVQEQADRERLDFAWLHNCGHLNHGYWHDRSVCGGCRFSVEHADDVEAHYRLVPVERLRDGP
jgi:hypothetical protein